MRLGKVKSTIGCVLFDTNRITSALPFWSETASLNFSMMNPED